MLYLLSPREVAEVDKTIYAFFDLYEYTKVGKVANLSLMTRAYRVTLFDICPGVGSELLHTEAHLALFTVESEYYSFYFFAYLEEVLCAAEVLSPRHFAYVDKPFDTGSDLYKCAVIRDEFHLALEYVPRFEVGVEVIPGVRSELLETKGDTCLVLIEVEDYYIDLLIKLYHFAGVRYAFPREVSNMDKTIYTTKIYKHTERKDVLNGTFEHLTLFELADNVALLLLELGFYQDLVRYNDILLLLIDLYDLELHCLVNESIVVTDGANIDL